MKLVAGEPLSLDQLAYVANLEQKHDDRSRAGMLPQQELLDRLSTEIRFKLETRRQRDQLRAERDEARQVAGRLRDENTRLRNLLRTVQTHQEP